MFLWKKFKKHTWNCMEITPSGLCSKFYYFILALKGNERCKVYMISYTSWYLYCEFCTVYLVVFDCILLVLIVRSLLSEIKRVLFYSSHMKWMSRSNSFYFTNLGIVYLKKKLDICRACLHSSAIFIACVVVLRFIFTVLFKLYSFKIQLI